MRNSRIDSRVVRKPTPLGPPVMIHATIDRSAGKAASHDGDDDEPATRPCAYCGRPVSQRASAGRPFRYCQDNDEACLRAARAARMRQRNAPGLAGQVAQAFDVVERLDRVAETLTEALHAELTPAGVERQLNALRAETTAQLSAAHAERDEARRETDVARADADQARSAAERATERAAAEVEAVRAQSAQTVEAALAEADAARTLAAEAVALADERVATAQADARAAAAAAEEALDRTREAQRDRDEARTAAAAAEAVRAEALRERDTLRAAVAEAAKARDAAQTEARLHAAAAEEASARTEAAVAELARVRAAGEHAAAVAEDRHRKQVAELDDARTALRSADQRVTDLARRLAAAEADQEAARADAAAARAHITQLNEQIGNLAAALARLGPPPRPASAEPAERGEAAQVRRPGRTSNRPTPRRPDSGSSVPGWSRPPVRTTRSRRGS